MKQSSQNIRLIPRLDIKGPNLIKGIQLEGLRVIGSPEEHTKKYYEQGADEIIYMDAVASLYNRNSLKDILHKAAQNIFIPITVGGGIRSLPDAESLLKSGADKVAVNTAVIQKPELISEIAERFGSQAFVLSVEAKYQKNGFWEAYIDNGRERTGIDVVQWVKKAESLGAGEILITSIDNEGTRKGYDKKLIDEVVKKVNIPVIVSGGMNSSEDIIDIYKCQKVEAFAMADILHYNRSTIGEIKKTLLLNNLPVRET